MTDFDRARAYVAKMPAAISGSGGHDATFAVAKTLVHDFALPEPEAWQILSEYNQRFDPPWNDRELKHKMKSAANLTRSKHHRAHLANDKPYDIYKDPAVYQQIPARPPIRVPDFEPEIIGEITLTEDDLRPKSRGEEHVGGSPEDAEARRLAGELVSIHRDTLGGITEADAACFCAVMRMFEANYVGRR